MIGYLSNEFISPIYVCEENQDHESAKRLRSKHCNDFDRRRIDGKMKVICEACKRALNSETSNGTTYLRNHSKVSSEKIRGKLNF